MSLLHAIILAVVEGLTEYLPISSTGHLIITSSFLGINELPFTKDYTIIVQFGAILSVLVLYFKRFVSGLEFYKKLLVAFLPAAVIGVLVKNHIDALLGSVTVVAVSLIAGGIVLVLSDRWFTGEANRREIAETTYGQSFIIGLCQCFAFIPGVSRAAATILGGLTQRMNRRAAAEFSFFLAVPTLTGATLLKLLKMLPRLQASDLQILVVGNFVSFVVGLLTIRLFIGFLSRGGFRWFGYYRIAVGVVILLLLAMGHPLSEL